MYRYRAAGRQLDVREVLTTLVEQVPVDDYTLPLGQVDTVRKGTDLTLVTYGTPLYTCRTSSTPC